jgi:hypothetical protein
MIDRPSAPLERRPDPAREARILAWIQGANVGLVLVAIAAGVLAIAR